MPARSARAVRCAVPANLITDMIVTDWWPHLEATEAVATALRADDGRNESRRLRGAAWRLVADLLAGEHNGQRVATLGGYVPMTDRLGGTLVGILGEYEVAPEIRDHARTVLMGPPG